jgi:hypothetical protein
MIERLQANPDILRFHVHYRCERAVTYSPLPLRERVAKTWDRLFGGP